MEFASLFSYIVACLIKLLAAFEMYRTCGEVSVVVGFILLKRMADRAGLCSNSLFDTLEEWEEQLKAADFEELDL